MLKKLDGYPIIREDEDQDAEDQGAAISDDESDGEDQHTQDLLKSIPSVNI